MGCGKNGSRDQRSQSRGTGEAEDHSREGRRNGGVNIGAAGDPATPMKRETKLRRTKGKSSRKIATPD